MRRTIGNEEYDKRSVNEDMQQTIGNEEHGSVNEEYDKLSVNEWIWQTISQWQYTANDRQWGTRISQRRIWLTISGKRSATKSNCNNQQGNDQQRNLTATINWEIYSQMQPTREQKIPNSKWMNPIITKHNTVQSAMHLLPNFGCNLCLYLVSLLIVAVRFRYRLFFCWSLLLDFVAERLPLIVCQILRWWIRVPCWNSVCFSSSLRQ